ncbi:DUF697 domain-containing protein [Pokkaliibacter sp. MBI-7]|uniref:DUF697 domain-containing protein n=1 Tax=Proteobacteria bacterium 228 TaxID=2083153 RepID=A0A2S5KQT3_9PROT|nr:MULTISPECIES: DUF697 domain-containing protein [Pokkaliibacter]MDH2434869.1 DUF697 domain-containing protein [Pokkaliibacter sp. MBI-7]PPC76626.1 hypothetical protein C4K68_14460 [Pokkaliibacter plantistimulans]
MVSKTDTPQDKPTPEVEATAAEATVEPEVQEAVISLDLDAQARKIIRHNCYWSMGAGLIPFIFVDTAALIAVQLKMLKELGDLYGVPFKANAGKSAVTSLLAGAGSGYLGYKTVTSGVVRRLVRKTPVIGTAITLATMPAFDSAFTYAVGKVFHRHFASGGDFLSFNAKKVQAEVNETIEEVKAKGVDAAQAAA